MEQNYKQVKQELGWADFMVRSDRAIRRHWCLVWCAFSCCWQAWFRGAARTTEEAGSEDLAEATSPAVRATPAGPEPGEKDAGRGADPGRQVAWPVTLRQVRGWLDPCTCLWRCWRAWSQAPPPPELQALLDAVGQGHPLNLYLPP